MSADCIEITESIYRASKEKGESEPPRGYLGASILGKECDRELWYGFRWATTPEFSGRMYRLFQRGHDEELRVVSGLRDAGYEVVDAKPDGSQYGGELFGGHFGFHIDGVIRGLPGDEKTWHLLEIKTHNERSYKATVKKIGRAHV